MTTTENLQLNNFFGSNNGLSSGQQRHAAEILQLQSQDILSIMAWASKSSAASVLELFRKL